MYDHSRMTHWGFGECPILHGSSDDGQRIFGRRLAAKVKGS